MSDDLALLPDEVRLAAHVLANGDADYVRSTAWSSQTAGRFW